MDGRMLHAFLDVREKGFTVRAAALQHGVAKSTLQERFTVSLPNRRRMPTMLTDFEEGVLATVAQGHELFGIALPSDLFLGIARNCTSKKRKQKKRKERLPPYIL